VSEIRKRQLEESFVDVKERKLNVMRAWNAATSTVSSSLFCIAAFSGETNDVHVGGLLHAFAQSEELGSEGSGL
jgi:hypothetical protein